MATKYTSDLPALNYRRTVEGVKAFKQKRDSFFTTGTGNSSSYTFISDCIKNSYGSYQVDVVARWVKRVCKPLHLMGYGYNSPHVPADCYVDNIPPFYTQEFVNGLKEEIQSCGEGTQLSKRADWVRLIPEEGMSLEQANGIEYDLSLLADYLDALQHVVIYSGEATAISGVSGLPSLKGELISTLQPETIMSRLSAADFRNRPQRYLERSVLGVPEKLDLFDATKYVVKSGQAFSRTPGITVHATIATRPGYYMSSQSIYSDDQRTFNLGIRQPSPDRIVLLGPTILHPGESCDFCVVAYGYKSGNPLGYIPLAWCAFSSDATDVLQVMPNAFVYSHGSASYPNRYIGKVISHYYGTHIRRATLNVVVRVPQAGTYRLAAILQLQS